MIETNISPQLSIRMGWYVSAHQRNTFGKRRDSGFQPTSGSGDDVSGHLFVVSGIVDGLQDGEDGEQSFTMCIIGKELCLVNNGYKIPTTAVILVKFDSAKCSYITCFKFEVQDNMEDITGWTLNGGNRWRI